MALLLSTNVVQLIRTQAISDRTLNEQPNMKSHMFNSFQTIVVALVMLFCIQFVAKAHTLHSDYCHQATFTDEAYNIRCDEKYLRFSSKGLPDDQHIMMVGIDATNQQVPINHNYQFTITRSPVVNKTKVATEAGAIGVAVNGVPIFDPSTQGKVNKISGKRPHTLLEGELDSCGGHAGRGDDYHYHIAPKCLIEQLGENLIEVKKQPIGFAKDGHPIHALGWFNSENRIEDKLDECRGYTDATGRYFYNVMREANWDVLNCFSGTPMKFSKDKWVSRSDQRGFEIIGHPIEYQISEYSSFESELGTCHVMNGVLKKEQLLITPNRTQKIRNKEGNIFYCNAKCYGMFFEADKKPSFKGRVMYYDLITSRCPVSLNQEQLTFFDAYEGPAQKYKPPQSTKKK